MLRSGDGTGLHALAWAAGPVRRYRDNGAGLECAHDPQQPHFAATLRRAAHGSVSPFVGERGEISSVTMAADEYHDAFPFVQREQRQDARVPQHKNEWRLPTLQP